MRGSGDVELGLLVDFEAASHLNTGAEQVLLGSCSSQAVPPNLRNMYTALHSDRQLHALWLKGIVGVLRACWAVHDAAVDDALAASGGDDPPIPPESPPPSRQDRLRQWQAAGFADDDMAASECDMPGILSGSHAMAPQADVPHLRNDHGVGEYKEEEDQDNLMEQKVPEQHDLGRHDAEQPAPPPLGSLGDLAVPQPGMPQPVLLRGLGSFLHAPASALPAVPAVPAVPPPPPSMLQRLVSAAPRGLMALIGMADTQDTYDDDDSPLRAHSRRQQQAPAQAAESGCPQCAVRSAPCPACSSAESHDGPSGAAGSLW